MKILLPVLTFLLFFSSCDKKEGQKDPIRPVITEEVGLISKAPPLYFSGFSKSEKFINTSFRVGGKIERIPIKVGDSIKKGQLIAKLDDTDYLLEMQDAKASYEKAQAEARKASAQYRRIKNLYESESASRDELDTYRAANESAKATANTNQSRLDLATKKLSYTTLYASEPYCEVSAKNAEIQENVEAGQTIAVLSCGKKLEVEIAVPETTIADIYEGQAVTIFFNALPNKQYDGVVQEVGVSASSGTTFPVTVALTKKHAKLRSGMAAKVKIQGKDIPYGGPVIVVPIDAVGEDLQGNFVYVFVPKDKDMGVARKVPVTVGEITPGGFVILDGIAKGDEIIIAGVRYLRDGKSVKRLDKAYSMKRKA